MRANYPRHQWSDYRHGPGCQLPSFQMHVDLTLQICKRFDQVCLAGLVLPLNSDKARLIQSYWLKTTRPYIESDVNSVHADVSFPSLNRYWKKQDHCPAGDICRLI